MDATKATAPPRGQFLPRIRGLLGNSIWIRVVLGLLALLLFAAVITVPLELRQQVAFACVTFAVALVLVRREGRAVALLLMLLSACMSLRYMYWRLTATVGFESWIDGFFGWGLVAAELYALAVLLLGYWQTAWPLQRQPLPMNTPSNQWPTVDVFIPTYDEPLSVVRQTVFAALSLDWPEAKFKVYVLDDGRREEFRQFCEEAGCGYLVREDNRDAKAGNLNAALAQTSGEYVAVFDCDHICTRSFLQVCMGWFIKDPRLAMLQTPHVYFSADPFEKNLSTFQQVPNEGTLFYGLVQDGNDLWNAAFFCGSCAIMRRSALDRIGGVAVGSVTEDALTALQLNRHGYNTAYLALPQAAGRATESLTGHIRQRMRWARGMAQIFRINNPLLGRGLSLGQRLCYLAASLHFFSGLPRIVFLTAPLAFLFFSAQVFTASAWMIAAYALPHIVHSSLANANVQGSVRQPFWNEVYETVLAWYIARPTMAALFSPKNGSFNVTPKGGAVSEGYFDWKMARPYMILLALNLLGLVVGCVRLFYAGADYDLISTLVMNLVWTLYNVVIVGASVAVASEAPQMRAEPRVHCDLPASVLLRNGNRIACRITDFSSHGLGVGLPVPMQLEAGEQVQVSAFRGDDEAVFDARVMRCGDTTLALQLEEMSMAQQMTLAQMTFSRADLWLDKWQVAHRESTWKAMRRVLGASSRGVAVLASELFGLAGRFVSSRRGRNVGNPGITARGR